MADRSIGELVAASQIGSTDLLVMEQGGTAKKVTGQLLENWLLQMAQGRGGIQTIEKTGTSGITDTYTITFSDESTTTFEVENGRGITGMTSSKTGTVTTVTLSYNDGTTSQFTVNDGEGVTEVVPYWAVSTSKTTQPTSWSSTPQSLTATYKYLWNYLRINYSDGSHQDTTPTVVGAYGDKGTKGDTGTSITSVTKIGTSGLVDTYRITFSNNTTTTFTITNGSSISTIERTSTSGLVDTYTVTLTNGETETFTVTNGKGISSITQISGSHAAGTSDTYRITYNDGDTYDFLVYNGANGTGAVSSVAGIGVSGSSGDVPLILWGNGAPTATTVGQEKQLYFDLSGGVMYICIGVAAGSYSWASMGITVDSALSSSSNNPVQNRIITQKVGTEALDGFTATTLTGAANELMTKKANKAATVSDVTYDSQNHRLRKTVNGTASTVFEVDTTPTENSMNPISSDAVAALNGAISDKEKTTFSGLGMFNRIGVIGDSFASGGIRPDNVISVLYENSWPQIISRKLGIAVTNYSVSGYSARDFVNPNDTNYNTHGLGAVLADITNQKTCGLYIFALGINDSTVSNPPSTYLGSITDINTSDPSQNADTFFGNTGKIISTILANAPNSKIVLQTFTRPANATGIETYNTFNNAIIAIANLFTLPYVDIRNDPYFKSDYYQNNLATNNTQHYRHPTLDMYVGYAEAIMRLYGACIVNNSDYFYNYKNTGIYNDKYYWPNEVITFANTYAHFIGVANSATQLRVFIPLSRPVKATSFSATGGFYLKSTTFTQNQYGVIVDSSPTNYDAVFGNASIIENGIAFSLTFAADALTAREIYGISTTTVNPLRITFS